MDSIFNSKSGVPHIGEKILKCMDIKSIVNCSSVNQGLRSYMENYIDNLNPMDFFKRVKLFLLKEVSQKKNIQGLWLPLIEIIDEKSLWNHDVKHQVYLCMIHQDEIHFHSISKKIPCSSWDMDEQRTMILDSAIGKKQKNAFKK